MPMIYHDACPKFLGMGLLFGVLYRQAANKNKKELLINESYGFIKKKCLEN
jgi:hypothetical protein